MPAARYRLSVYAGLVVLAITGCATAPSNPWTLQLAHDADGQVTSGSSGSLVDAIRAGCQIRVGWGARRKADPSRTIEHSATPLWVAVRDGDQVEVQLDDFLINLAVLGEPPEQHTNRERFGGVSEVVMWRANLKTDGSFNAVWFSPHSGKLVTRIPQRHPMKWYADCSVPTAGEPLFPAN